jgi:FkbM family methyltransferase
MNHLIDCGSNYFDGLNSLNRIYYFGEGWKIDCFEANPLTYNDSLQSKPSYNCEVVIHNKVIWKIDGHVNVNINADLPLDNGTNILEIPPDRDIQYNRKFNWQEKINVPCVDLAKIIRDSDSKFIVVKMDIEGAEFEVLQHLIKENALQKINHLYVEFHERFFISELEKYRELKQQLMSTIGKSVQAFGEWH